MAETTLISLIPAAAQLTGIQSSPNPQSAPNVPAAMANLPLGTLITGFVLSRDQQGNPVLRTDQGDMLIKSDMFLKIGSEVTIRIEALAGTIRARIMSIDGLSPSLYTQQAQQGLIQDDNVVLLNTTTTPNTPSQQAAAQATHTPIEVLEEPTFTLPDKISVRGVLVSPAPNAASVVSTLPSSIPTPSVPLQPGAEISVRLVTADIVATHTLQTNLGAQTLAITRENLLATQGTIESLIGKTPLITAGQTIPATAQTATQAAGTATTPLPSTTTPASGIVSPPQAPGTTVATPGTNPPGPNPASVPPTPPATPPTAPTTQSSSLSAMTTTAAPASKVSAPVATPLTATSTPPALTPAATSQPNIPAAIVPPTPSATAAPGTSQGASVSAPLAAPATTPAQSTLVPGTMPATVVGTEKSGELVLHTPLGTLKLPSSVDLPTGSQVTLELVALKNPTAPTSPALASNLPLPPALASVSELSHQWASLSALVSALAKIDPQAAQHIIQNVMPQTGPQMTGGVMLFLFALRGGDIRQWLGAKPINQLEQSGHGELVRKVTSEFNALRTAFLEQPSQSWQMVFVPLAHGEELHQARLFIKRDKEKEKNEGKKSAADNTRFVLEVELSELGNLQMDGLVRKKEEQVFFDLYIRSMNEFSHDMQHDIHEIFNKTAQMTGFKGTILFQAVDEFPVKPLDEMMAEAAKPIIA